MDPAELFSGRENLWGEFQEHLARFLETELQLGYTFAALATTERVLGNGERFRVAKGDAAKAAAAIRKFLNRIDDTEIRRKADERCTQLERSIHLLDAPARDQDALRRA